MHKYNVMTAAASGDGTLLATGSAAGEVILWRTAPFAPVGELPQPDQRSRGKVVLAINGDGSRVAVAGAQTGAVEFWDPASLARLRSFAAHGAAATAVAFGPDRLLATAGANREPSATGADVADEDGDDDVIPETTAPVVRLWRDGARIKELEGAKQRIRALAFDDAGERLAAASDGAVLVWRLPAGELEATHELEGEAATVAFAAGRLCAVSSRTAVCFRGKSRTDVAGARAPTRAAHVDAQWLVTGTFDHVEVRAMDGAGEPTLIEGRAYAVVATSDALWAILADRALVIRDGQAGGEHPLKATATEQ